jgi:TolB protein
VKDWKGTLRAGIALCAAALLFSCSLRGAQVTQSPLLRFFERASGLITYVDQDGNVAIMDQKGGRRRALTRDATSTPGAAVVYLSPTWSPDGRQVAFTRLALGSDGTVTEASLFTESRDGRNQKQLLTGTRLQPFYLYWAPDSRRLSVLSEVTGEQSLEMGVATAGTEGDYRVLDRGSPFYWGWRPDGQSVVIHTNMGQLSEPERLSVLDPGGSAARSDLPVDGGSYQAPSFSPDGKSLAYVSSFGTSFALHRRSVEGPADEQLATGDGGVYFSFSPDGRHLAYLAASSVQPVAQGTLTVIDLAGGATRRTLTEEPVIEFYWSPDGRTIAFLTPETEGSVDPMFMQSSDLLTLRLMGYDTATGKTWLIAAFPPSRGMLAVMPYFDQYQRSATIWSPDSRFIEFTAIAAEGYPAIYVSRVDGNTKPRFLMAGDYAFWSGK